MSEEGRFLYRNSIEIEVVSGILEACGFAARYHGHQIRRSGGLYILHPMEVARNLTRLSVVPPGFVLFAAILHDVIEDTEASFTDISRQFGITIASLVLELTNDKSKIAEVGKTDYLCQKVENMSKYALLIKLADRYDNLSDLKHRSFGDERNAEYARGTWKMLRVIGKRPTSSRAEGQDELVQKIEKLLISAGYEPPLDDTK